MALCLSLSGLASGLVLEREGRATSVQDISLTSVVVHRTLSALSILNEVRRFTAC
ncbi:hypothetical protein OK016_14115 [Vibrio chagasii]|nr:hypothetical protein [Vibrio chagasii]